MPETIAPLMIAEEQTAAEADFGSLLQRDAALFLTRVKFDGAIAANAETAAALTLITNLLLMQRSPSGVMKFVEINATDEKVPAPAVANLIRGLLTGEFSALANFENWIAILEENAPVPADVHATAEKSIQFLESYSARQRLAMEETADFFLSLQIAGINEKVSVFSADEPFYGAINIASGKQMKRFFWSEYYKQRSVTVRYLHHSSHLVLDLDFTLGGNVVEDWMSALRAINYLD